MATIERQSETVKTPIPANPGAGGYDTEENRRVKYFTEDRKFLVQKIGNHGWSVWEYIREGDIWSTEDRLAKEENAQSAHRIAQMRATEVQE
jgi:predicted component of viral defense system (DUF524 family)